MGTLPVTCENTLPGAPEPLAQSMSDALLRGYALREIEARGLSVLSLTYARSRGQPGWSDLVLFCPGGHTLFAELKQAQGRLSFSQQQKARELRSLGFTYRIWRPGDWVSRRIHRELDILAGGPEPRQEAA